MLTLLSDEKYAQAIAQTPQGVLIGFKKLCPHCKNMEKVLEKCADRLPGTVFMGLDTEENPDACGRLGIEARADTPDYQTRRHHRKDGRTHESKGTLRLLPAEHEDGMSGERLYDVLVLGGGPAGTTAALYAKRANLRVALLETNVTGAWSTRRTRWKTSRRILKSTAWS